MTRLFLSLLFILVSLTQPGNACSTVETCHSINTIANQSNDACSASEKSCCCKMREYSDFWLTYPCQCSEQPGSDKTISYFPLLSSEIIERAVQNIATFNVITTFSRQSVIFAKPANSRSSSSKLYLIYRALLI